MLSLKLQIKVYFTQFSLHLHTTKGFPMKNLFLSTSRFVHIAFHSLLVILYSYSHLASQCNNIVSAGPDMFTCDPSMMVQLQGMINGSPTKVEWTPITGLSDSKALDPMVTIKTPGKYKFKLSAEVIGTNNLILNGNFEAGYSGFSTEYVFKTLGTGFGPDNVAIATNPRDYNSGFQTCGDHTSGSSNMLLVDGSTVAGKNVWCQTVAVTPGNMYQFELYSMLVFPNSPSVISIKVNGNPIGGGQVGGMCDWTLMSACFTATTASAQICISEVTGVGFGNDFALDDIAMYEKCIAEDEVEVEIVDLKAQLVIPNKPKCSSEIFDLFGTGSSSGNNITYMWSTDRGEIISQNGLIAKARGSGTYTLKVIYRNGNTYCEKDASIDYEAPDKLEGLTSVKGIANCNKDTITIDVTMNTGSGDYSYKWEPALDILKGDTSDQIKVLKAQNYKVTITDINTGCKLELEKTVSADTTIPNFNLFGDSIINCVKKNILLVSSLNDISKFIYEWILPNNNAGNGTNTLLNNQSGKYTLKVTDKLNKCFDTKFWQVNIDTTQPKTSVSKLINIDCINTNPMLTPTGINSTDVKYYWTMPDGLTYIDDSIKTRTVNKNGFVIIRTLNQLNGCQDIDSALINDIRQYPSLSLTAVKEINCTRSIVDLTAISNNNNLSITWNTPNGNIIGNNNQLNIMADKKGIYYITLKDTTNQCEIIDSIEVLENITKPTVLLGPDLIFQCKDSIVNINGSMSSSGPSYQFDWTSNDGNISSGNGTNQITVRQAGTYKLVITDIRNGCKDSANIKVNPDASKPILSITQPKKFTCTINSISLEAIANSQSGNNLNYIWTSNNNQPITNSTQSNPQITIPGTYTVIVTDIGNGCTSSSIVTVGIDTLRPGANAGNSQTLSCGLPEVNINGSSLNTNNNLIYEWTTSSGNIITTNDPKSIKTKTAGVYNLKITDPSNGCESYDQITILIDTIHPIINIVNPDTLTCNTIAITISSAGSSSGSKYNYQWTTQDGNIIDPNKQNNIRINKKGRYQLVISDTSNKCSITKFVDVYEDISSPVLNISSPLELTCKIRQTGLNVNIFNTSNAVINWISPNGTIVSGNNQSNPIVSKPAWYFVQVTGKNGCLAIDSVLVKENTNIPNSIVPSYNNPLCPNDIASLNSINSQGGEQPIQYLLDGNLITNFPITNLSSGLHTIKLIDKNGCELSNTFIIDQPSPVDVKLPNELKVNEGENLTLQFTSTIPTDSIQSIEWQPADKLSCIDCPNPQTKNLEDENVFTVTITNKNGCSATSFIRIVKIRRGAWIPNTFSPNGDNINDIFHIVGIEESIKRVRTFQIYDRWGSLMYRNDNIASSDLKNGWDGKFKGEQVNSGVYTYWFVVEWNNGETQQFQGDLTLVR